MLSIPCSLSPVPLSSLVVSCSRRLYALQIPRALELGQLDGRIDRLIARLDLAAEVDTIMHRRRPVDVGGLAVVVEQRVVGVAEGDRIDILHVGAHFRAKLLGRVSRSGVGE